MNYTSKFTYLVELERQAEMEHFRREIQQLTAHERRELGRCEYELHGQKGSNVFHYHVVKFTKFKGCIDTRMNTGDLVLISKGNPNESDLTGTILDINSEGIRVAFETKIPKWVLSGQIRIDLYANDITYQRMLTNLSLFSIHKHPLKNLILDEREPYAIKHVDFEPFNPQLNQSQKAAISNALGTRDIFAIHGPPGTGKTTTLCELIYQAANRSKSVLATAESNIAADNILAKLSQYPALNIVRLGHPARIIPGLESYSLFNHFGSHKRYAQVQAEREALHLLKDKRRKFIKPESHTRRGLKQDQIQQLARKGKSFRGINRRSLQSMSRWLQANQTLEMHFQKLKALEDEIFAEIIEQADVVICTNSMAGSAMMEKHYFDLSVIDEGSQAIEPSTLIPMTKARRVIVAGDDQQLPPTVISPKAQPLRLSFFERFKKTYPKHSAILTEQYRMNQDILSFPNKHFYQNKITTPKQVAKQKLSDLFKNSSEDLKQEANQSVIFINTAEKINLSSPFESKNKRSSSYENQTEILQVIEVLKAHQNKSIDFSQIGIISPYQGQVKLLKKTIELHETLSLYKNILEIKSIDGFQGREKEVIILSLVRANSAGNIGFLNDLRRLNVAITRAKRKLVVIGHEPTLQSHAVYKAWIESIKDIARG